MSHDSHILALDLGTLCGWAVYQKNGVLLSGVWDFSPHRFEGGGMRFVRFRRELEIIYEAFPQLEAIYFEEVRRHLGTTAAHIYGGFTGHLEFWCEERKPKMPYQGIPVGTIKKYACHKGNVGKPEMLAAAQRKWPGRFFKDDNEVDACWIAMCALEK